MRRFLRPHPRRMGRRGNAAIEFAVIGPVFVLAIIAVFEIGAQLMASAMLDYGMRMASRWGVTGNTAPGGVSRADYIRSTILTASGGFLRSDRLTLTLQSYGSWSNARNGTGIQGNPLVNNPGSSSTIVNYRATYRQPFMTGFATTVLRGRTFIDHTSATVVNNEPYPL